MKQVWIPHAGDPSVLEVREREDPIPGYGEVRIRVRAAGVNFADLLTRMGMYRDAPPLPTVVGYEVAGAVDEVGPGVERSAIGREVVAVTHFGGYSSHVVVKEELAISRPPGMTAEIGAAIPVSGLTAWMMIEEMGRVREGDRVLVHSAGGSIGLMALDLLRRRGAIGVGTASGHKHDFLRAWGFAELVDYTTEDFEEALSKGPPFDLILDPLGGASWGKGFRLLKRGGRLILFGYSSYTPGSTRSVLDVVKNLVDTPWSIFNPVKLINANKGIIGLNMGTMWSESERLSSYLEKLFSLWTAGKLRARVHAAVPFSKAAEAHRLLHDRQNLGKVLLIPD